MVLFGGFVGAFVIVMTVLIAMTVTLIVSNYKLFEKAGYDGWKALVPILNVYTMIKIAFGDKKLWLMIGLFLPLATSFMGQESVYMISSSISAILNIYLAYGFMRRFAGVGFSITSVFIPLISYPIAAFSNKYQYEPLTESC